MFRLSSEVTCALISLAGVVVSVLSSIGISIYNGRKTTKNLKIELAAKEKALEAELEAKRKNLQAEIEAREKSIRTDFENKVRSMQIEWEREDGVAENERLQRLGECMGEFLNGDGFYGKFDSMKAIQGYRATASRKCSEIAGRLSDAVINEDVGNAGHIWDELLEAAR